MPDFLTWDTLKHALNANFIASVTGALAGALAGATAAQKIAARGRRAEALTQEIRSTNGAITLAFAICNSGITLKRQFVASIFDIYQAKRMELAELKRAIDIGRLPGGAEYELQADFRTLQIPHLPINPLQALMYERISACGRPVALGAALAGSIASLGQVIHTRNALIERIQRVPDRSLLVALYFGTPYGDGHVDTQYSDTINSLHNLTDDVIYFSDLLIQDLTAHGDQLVSELKRVDKSVTLKIQRVNFKEARDRGWIPGSANYGDWERCFGVAAQQSV